MILVTGANGLVGRALVRQLIDGGEKVRAQVRSKGKLLEALNSFAELAPLGSLEQMPLLEVMEFDLSSDSEQQYCQLVSDCSAVVHCGGIVHRPSATNAEYAVANVRASGLLAAAAVQQQVRTFVFLSSSAVYGDGPFVGVNESASLTPHTAYGLSKANSEQAITRESGLQRTIILRPSLIFGEGDRGNMRSLIKQIRSGLYFHIRGNSALKSVIHSEDAATAIRLCLQHSGSGTFVFNLSNPQPVSVIDLANTIAHVLGKPAPPTVPGALVRACARVAEMIFAEKSPLTLNKMQKLMTSTTLDTSALQAAAGWVPALSLDQALRREIAWLSAD